MKDTKRLIFVHPPKCAGTSIRQILRDEQLDFESFGEFCNDKHTGHWLAQQWIDQYKQQSQFNRDDFYIVGMCRNPFDRVVSFYWHIVTHRDYDKSFEHYVQNDIDQLISFERFFHYNNEFVLDDVIRHEQLWTDFEKVAIKLNITDYPHHHIDHDTKRPSKVSYRDYYTDETIAIVKQKYKWDIEFFGYQF